MQIFNQVDPGANQSHILNILSVLEEYSRLNRKYTDTQQYIITICKNMQRNIEAIQMQ